MAKNKQKNKKTAQRDMAKKKSKRKELIIVSIAAGLLLMLLISLVAVRLVNSSGVNISEIYTDGYQTVTLYKNGEAQLSNALTSSTAPDMGFYWVEGNNLTFSYNAEPSVIFEFSDNGDTLTVTSASINNVEVGAVYKYRPSADN